MGFLDDLSTGIFEKQHALEDEQKVRDREAQRNTLTLLTGLADKIEPDSLPILMGEIGKALNVKGKMKTFWEAFSGMPNRSVEDQLGTQLRELNMVGSDSARRTRQRADMARLFQPTSPLAGMFTNKAPQAQNRQNAINAENDLSRAMVVRDPRRERLDEIEARYAAQTEAAMQREAVSKALANKYQTERDEANRKGRINQIMTKYMLDSQKDIDKLAWQYYIQDVNMGVAEYNENIVQPPFKYQQMATQELQRKSQLQDKKTNAQINALNAQGGGGAGKPLTKAQQAQIDQEITGEAQKIFSAIEAAKVGRKSAIEKRDALQKQLTDFASRRGVTFDPNTGMFTGDDMKAAQAKVMLEIQSPQGVNLVDEYLKAKGEADKASGAVNTEFEKLRTDRYKNYVTIGKTADDAISLKPQRGQRPPAAVRQGGDTPARVPRTRGGNPATAGAATTLRIPSDENQYKGKEGTTIVYPKGGRYIYRIDGYDRSRGQWVFTLVGAR